MAAQICEYCRHKNEGCYCSPNSTCDKYEVDVLYGFLKPIKAGSILYIGKDFKTILKVDQRFNWFQRLMWKLCFGVKVEYYNEE